MALVGDLLTGHLLPERLAGVAVEAEEDELVLLGRRLPAGGAVARRCAGGSPARLVERRVL